MKYSEVKRILESAFSKSNIYLTEFKRASEGITSHDVMLIDFELNSIPSQVVLKTTPTDIRSPKKYNLQKEVKVLDALAKRERVYVPKVIYSDFSRSIIDKDLFLMEPIWGKNMADFMREDNSRESSLYWTSQIAGVMANIHSSPLEDFSFLEQEDYGKYFLNEMDRMTDMIKPKFTKCKPARELQLINEVIKKLRVEKPLTTDFALINGDISPNHIIQKEKKWYILDWDPSRIGDKSWDLYWFLKGIPAWVLGIDDGIERLTEAYEKNSSQKLKNSIYYQTGAVAFAYIYGIHIIQNDPTHPHRSEIPELTSRMIGRLESYIK
jgi:aminoglycoside phosphotransferase (APT) family kinase protein